MGLRLRQGRWNTKAAQNTNSRFSHLLGNGEILTGDFEGPIDADDKDGHN